jgi:hypothetical protein
MITHGAVHPNFVIYGNRMTEIRYKGALINAPLPGLDDVEGENVPPGIPAVTDAHVHLFPD